MPSYFGGHLLNIPNYAMCHAALVQQDLSYYIKLNNELYM